MRFIDLTGQRFGKLLVIKKLIPQIGRHARWVCKCDCGQETAVKRENLVSGGTQSCGRHQYKDLTGQRFGKLTCLELGPGRPHASGTSLTWICLCDCGNKTDVLSGQLTSKRTRSCGCIRKKQLRERAFKGYLQISGKFWSSISGGAKRRGLIFEITKEFIWELYEKQNRKCALSGIDIVFELNYKLNTASIDRIDNSKGYLKDNVQIVHKKINIMKNNFEQLYFIDICCSICRTQNNKNNNS